jgi:hypothetical protein
MSLNASNAASRQDMRHGDPWSAKSKLPQPLLRRRLRNWKDRLPSYAAMVNPNHYGIANSIVAGLAGGKRFFL